MPVRGQKNLQIMSSHVLVVYIISNPVEGILVPFPEKNLKVKQLFEKHIYVKYVNDIIT